MRLLVLFVRELNVSVSLNLCSWPYVCKYCICAVLSHPYCEYTLSLAAACTWGHEAFTTSPLLVYQTQQLQAQCTHTSQPAGVGLQLLTWRTFS